MGKRRLLICFAVITMLITGCGEKPAVLPLKLPDAEQITRNSRKLIPTTSLIN